MLFYKGFVANAAVISSSVLMIPKENPITRPVIVTLVFGLSAIVHLVGGKLVVPACNGNPLYLWYLIQSQVIIVEGLIDLGFNYFTKDWKSSALRSGFWKILGYVWVAFIFGWSIPKMQLPNIDCEWKAAA